MRRVEREIEDINHMLSVMGKCDVCRIGLVDIDNATAYIVPLNFGYELRENKLTLYFHSAKAGKKICLMKKTPNACFEMDTAHKLISSDISCGFSMEYQSIMGNGTIRLIEKKEEKLSALKILMEHYTDAQLPYHEKMLQKVCIFALDVDDINCKANMRSST